MYLNVFSDIKIVINTKKGLMGDDKAGAPEETVKKLIQETKAVWKNIFSE